MTTEAGVDAPATTITGGCLCGRVRYQIAPTAPKATICHCAGCRRASAAPAVAWITVPATAFALVQGDLRTVRQPALGRDTCDGCGGERGFCAHCGTQITFSGDGRTQEIDVTTGSLDHPECFPPTVECFPEQAVGWLRAAIE